MVAIRDYYNGKITIVNRTKDQYGKVTESRSVVDARVDFTTKTIRNEMGEILAVTHHIFVDANTDVRPDSKIIIGVETTGSQLKQYAVVVIGKKCGWDDSHIELFL